MLQSLILLQFDPSKILDMATRVATPLSGFVFLVSLVLLLYFSLQRQKFRINSQNLQLLETDKRSDYISKLAQDLGITPEILNKLNNEQISKIVLERLSSEREKFRITAIASVILALLVVLFLLFINPPNLLDADLKLEPIQQIDFRTEKSPEHNDFEREKAHVYITAPVAIRNISQPGKNASINESKIYFSLGGEEYEFIGKNFVNMHEERFGLWMGINESFHSYTVESGVLTYKEILHEQSNNHSNILSWGAFLNLFTESEDDLLTIKLVIRSDVGELEEICQIDSKYWRNQKIRFDQKVNRIPGRLTAKCT